MARVKQTARRSRPSSGLAPTRQVRRSLTSEFQAARTSTSSAPSFVPSSSRQTRNSTKRRKLNDNTASVTMADAPPSPTFAGATSSDDAEGQLEDDQMTPTQARATLAVQSEDPNMSNNSSMSTEQQNTMALPALSQESQDLPQQRQPRSLPMMQASPLPNASPQPPYQQQDQTQATQPYHQQYVFQATRPVTPPNQQSLQARHFQDAVAERYRTMYNQDLRMIRPAVNQAHQDAIAAQYQDPSDFRLATSQAQQDVIAAQYQAASYPAQRAIAPAPVGLTNSSRFVQPIYPTANHGLSYPSGGDPRLYPSGNEHHLPDDLRLSPTSFPNPYENPRAQALVKRLVDIQSEKKTASHGPYPWGLPPRAPTNALPPRPIVNTEATRYPVFTGRRNLSIDPAMRGQATDPPAIHDRQNRLPPLQPSMQPSTLMAHRPTITVHPSVEAQRSITIPTDPIERDLTRRRAKIKCLEVIKQEMEDKKRALENKMMQDQQQTRLLKAGARIGHGEARKVNPGFAVKIGNNITNAGDGVYLESDDEEEEETTAPAQELSESDQSLLTTISQFETSSTAWSIIARAHEKRTGEAMTPVECMERAVRLNAAEGTGVVLESVEEE